MRGKTREGGGVSVAKLYFSKRVVAVVIVMGILEIKLKTLCSEYDGRPVENHQ